jgi:KDO2-lipid IV(A) lauroyltransferase
MAESFAKLIAHGQFFARRRVRSHVAHNLRAVLGCDLPPREIERLSKNLFANFSRSIYCFLRLPWVCKDELSDCCRVTGPSEALEKLDTGGGFVLAGPHVGPWELGGACLAARGLRIHTVAFEHPSASVTRFFEKRRESAGIKCHPIGNSFESLSNALRAGDCVALLIDRCSNNNGKKRSLFGREVPLPTGHARLAVRCDVPIVTAACVFTEDDGPVLELRGPYQPDPVLDKETAVDDLVERCRRDIELFVRRYPDQWFNFKSI